MLDNLGSIGQQPKLDITNYPNVKCDKCGSELFKSSIIIKKIPGVALGAGQEELISPIKIFVCAECGEILLSDRKELKLKEFSESKNNEQSNSLII